MKYKIYKRCFEGKVIYIGYTTMSLKRRKSCNSYKKDILNKCDIELIEETDDVSRERYWVNYYRSLGHELVNIDEGDGFVKEKHYTENRSIYLENNKEYVKNNKEKVKEYQKQYREKKKLEK